MVDPKALRQHRQEQMEVLPLMQRGQDCSREETLQQQDQTKRRRLQHSQGGVPSSDALLQIRKPVAGHLSSEGGNLQTDMRAGALIHAHSTPAANVQMNSAQHQKRSPKQQSVHQQQCQDVGLVPPEGASGSSKLLQVAVNCGTAVGMLDIGRMIVMCVCASCTKSHGAAGKEHTPAEFELHGSCNTCSWESSIKVQDSGQPVGEWLNEMEPTIAAATVATTTTAAKAAKEAADAGAGGSKHKPALNGPSRKRSRQLQQQQQAGDMTAAAATNAATGGQPHKQTGPSSLSECAAANRIRKMKQKWASVTSLHAPAEVDAPASATAAAAAAASGDRVSVGCARFKTTCASGSDGSGISKTPNSSKKQQQQDAKQLRNITIRKEDRWEVQIHLQKQHVYVGVYSTQAEAVQARDLAMLAVLGESTGTLQPAAQYTAADIAAMQQHMATKPAALAAMCANGLWQQRLQKQGQQDPAGASAAAVGAAPDSIAQHRRAETNMFAPQTTGKQRDPTVSSAKQQQKQENGQELRPGAKQQQPNLLYITHRDRRDNWEVQLNAPAVPGSGGSRKVYVGSYPTQDEAVQARDLAVTAVYGQLPDVLQPSCSFPADEIAAMRQQLASKPAALEVMTANGLWPLQPSKAVHRSTAAAVRPGQTAPAAAANTLTPAGVAKCRSDMLDAVPRTKQVPRSAPAAVNRGQTKLHSTVQNAISQPTAATAGAAAHVLADSGRVTRQQQQQGDELPHTVRQGSSQRAIAAAAAAAAATQKLQQEDIKQTPRQKAEQPPGSSQVAAGGPAFATASGRSTRQQHQTQQQQQQGAQLSQRLPHIRRRGESRWDVQLTSQGLRCLHVATCSTLEQAIRARDLAVLAVHGDKVPTLQQADSYKAADVAFTRQQLAVKPTALQVMIENGLWEAGDQAPTAAAAGGSSESQGAGRAADVTPSGVGRQQEAAAAGMHGQSSATAAVWQQQQAQPQQSRKRLRQQQEQHEGPALLQGLSNQELLQQPQALPYVVHRADRNRWLVQMYPHGLGRLYIGAYISKAEATRARDLTALALYGSTAETLHPASDYSAAEVADMRQQLSLKPVAATVMKESGVLAPAEHSIAASASAEATEQQQNRIKKQQQQLRHGTAAADACAAASGAAQAEQAVARKQPQQLTGIRRQTAVAAAAGSLAPAQTAVLAEAAAAATSKQPGQSAGTIQGPAAAAAARAARQQQQIKAEEQSQPQGQQEPVQQLPASGKQETAQLQLRDAQQHKQQPQAQRPRQHQHQQHGLPNIRPRAKGKYDVWLRGHGVEYVRIAHCYNTADAVQQRDLAVLAVFGNVSWMPTIKAADAYSAADVAAMRQRLVEQSPSAKAVMVANGLWPFGHKQRQAGAAGVAPAIQSVGDGCTGAAAATASAATIIVASTAEPTAGAGSPAAAAVDNGASTGPTAATVAAAAAGCNERRQRGLPAQQPKQARPVDVTATAGAASTVGETAAVSAALEAGAGGAAERLQRMQRRKDLQQQKQQQRAAEGDNSQSEMPHRTRRLQQRPDRAQPEQSALMDQQQHAAAAESSQQQQQQSKHQHKQLPQSLPNISHRMDRGKWEVFLHAGKGSKSLYVGSFSSQAEAVQARDLAVLAMHGEKAATLEPARLYEAADVTAMRQQLAAKPAARAALIANGMLPAASHKLPLLQQQQQQQGDAQEVQHDSNVETQQQQQQLEGCQPGTAAAAGVVAIDSDEPMHALTQQGAQQLLLQPTSAAVQQLSSSLASQLAAVGGAASTGEPQARASQQLYQFSNSAAPHPALQPVAAANAEQPLAQYMGAGVASAAGQVDSFAGTAGVAAEPALPHAAALAGVSCPASKHASASTSFGRPREAQLIAPQLPAMELDVFGTAGVAEQLAILSGGGVETAAQQVGHATATTAATDFPVFAAAVPNVAADGGTKHQDSTTAAGSETRTEEPQVQQLQGVQQQQQQVVCGEPKPEVANAAGPELLRDAAEAAAPGVAITAATATEVQLVSAAAAADVVAVTSVSMVSKQGQLHTAEAAMPAAPAVKRERDWVEEVESGDLMELDELDMLL